MSEELKRCKFCGRIITDENMLGLCPKHQKKANEGGALIGVAGVALLAKKVLPKVPKYTKTIIKMIRK